MGVCINRIMPSEKPPYRRSRAPQKQNRQNRRNSSPHPRRGDGRKGLQPKAEATHRANIKPGLVVDIVLKKDQGTDHLTRGVVANLLTNSATHHWGIKVRLQDGQVGRVHQIIHPQSE